MGQGVPPVVRGELVIGIRHQGDLCGLHLQHQIHIPWNGVTLDIEFGGKQRFEVGHILIAYVPFIGSGMNGNTLGTELFAVECHTQHIGIIATPCIAQGGYLVDIDA